MAEDLYYIRNADGTYSQRVSMEGATFNATIDEVGVNNFPAVQDVQLTGRNVQQETTLQNAVSAVGNGTAINMGNTDTFKITEISGTSTSRTLIFEVSNAETGAYSVVQGVKLADLSMATQTSGKDEIWQIDGLAGLWFRVRVSAIAGGNVTVKGKAVA